MYLDYPVKLSAHQHIVASSHKLESSVYSLCSIDRDLVGCEKRSSIQDQLLFECVRANMIKVPAQRTLQIHLSCWRGNRLR